MAGGSLSDILTAIQQGVVALNKLGGQVKGSFTNILSRFVVDEANIASNTANIATNTTNIATNTTNITALQALVPAPKFTNSLSSDVLLNVIGTYFTGPTVAQGSSGTWWASGTVTCTDTANAGIVAKLWDGTTVIDSARMFCTASGQVAIALSGFVTSPASNIRISVADVTNNTGKILFNVTTESHDSTMSVFRIG